MYNIERVEINKELIEFVEDNWGANFVISRGKAHSINNLENFVVKENNSIIGLITYYIKDNECEIVTIDSIIENQGIGSNLIEIVINIAKNKGCKRVWLITTNDNTRAIRFYQKRGFNMINLYPNALEESRKLKPQIPLLGFDDIPIKHEIEFEILL